MAQHVPVLQISEDGNGDIDRAAFFIGNSEGKYTSKATQAEISSVKAMKMHISKKIQLPYLRCFYLNKDNLRLPPLLLLL